MKALTIRSFAKINLGLRVLGRRPDGYHDIHTTLQAIDLCDLLTFEQGSGLSLAVEGRYAVACDASNLVMRAAKAMSELCPGRGAKITLRKEIPPGSGLGGGSSNAAVTLLALDRLWGAGLQPAARLELARSLGSDVPFFLHGGACLGVGRGDEVVPLPDTDDWHVLVIWPGVTLSTREVYEGLPRALTRSRILSSMKGFNPGRPPRAAGEESSSAEGGQAGEAAQARPVAVQNDLEETVFRRLPHLRRIKQQLLEAGATASALTGSGSAIFGLFGSARGLDRLGKALSGDKVAVFQCRTLSRKAYCFNLFKRS